MPARAGAVATGGDTSDVPTSSGSGKAVEAARTKLILASATAAAVVDGPSVAVAKLAVAVTVVEGIEEQAIAACSSERTDGDFSSRGGDAPVAIDKTLGELERRAHANDMPGVDLPDCSGCHRRDALELDGISRSSAPLELDSTLLTELCLRGGRFGLAPETVAAGTAGMEKELSISL